ncbi:MAG TPA: Rrf2 family transcriptional regulator [Candidatus Kapabacteria bacterium]|nr:Rrf2 family transcriptional regulator [Candidatus Kapabacteria bacterium]
MLSLTCKASIKAVVYLGSISGKGKKVSIHDVAVAIDENEHTVAKLLQKLSKNKIINSVKGPNGGFSMTEAQKSLPVINIINTIDGEDVFENCGLGLNECSETKPCPFHSDFKPIRESFKVMCTNKKINELYEEVNNGITFLIN